MKKIVKLPLLLLSLVCTLAALQCKKNKNPNSDNGLPPATQDGARTFACRANGMPWITVQNTFFPGGGYRNDTLSVDGFNNSDDNNNGDIFMIDLLNIPIIQGQIYRLNDTLKQRVRCTFYTATCFSNRGGYGTNTVFATDGELHLTKLDTINHIISGTFWFNIPTQYCDTIHVTDGRFDIKYKY